MRTKLAQLLSISVVAVAWMSASAARAQGIRVFVMGGGSFLQNERFFTAVGDRFRSNYAPGGKITLGGELSLGDVAGFEGSYGYGRNNLRLRDLTESETLGYGVRSQRFSANLMLHTPTSVLGVRPYGTAGLEYDHFGPTSQAKTLAFTEGFANHLVTLGASNQVGFNFGGGAELSLLPALALRLDLRDHITGTPTYGLSSAQFHVSGAAHNVELSLGLTLHLGK
jgi:opacity protein-like surface antigen